MKLGVAFGYSIRGAMLATFIVFNSQCANAQVQTALTDPTYLAVTSTSNPGGICGPPYCVNPNQGISLEGTSKNSMPLGPVRVCCPDGMILGD